MAHIRMYSDELLGWRRKSGPPRVWRIVEGRKKTSDGKPIRFSIQEIPEDRYDEVLELMSTVFVRDEPICANVELDKDPEAMSDFRRLWIFALEQGIALGAFLVDENNPKPPLAGTNMIMVNNTAVERGMEQAIKIGSQRLQAVITFMHDLDEELNLRKYYNVDEYITAFGLCVDREYRGFGLGYELLKTRDEISAAYGIPATSTVFSGPIACKAAASAGFDVLIEHDYADIRNEDGTELFPGIEAKTCKLMGKRFVKVK